MGSDGLDADIEPGCDLSGGESAADQLEDFPLPVGQPVDGGSVDGFRVFPEIVQDIAHDFFTDVYITAENPPDGMHHGFGGLVFHHVSHGPGMEASFGMKPLVVHGKNENEDFLSSPGELPDQVDAVGVLEGQIDDHHVGLELPDAVSPVIHVAGVSAYLQVLFLVDQFAHAHPEDGVIFYDHDSRLFFVHDEGPFFYR